MHCRETIRTFARGNTDGHLEIGQAATRHLSERASECGGDHFVPE